MTVTIEAPDPALAPGEAAPRRMPAEWEPHARCWMGWPTRLLWGGDHAAAARDYAAVAHAVAAFEPVAMLVDPAQLGEARSMLGAGIEIIEMPLDDAWLRDSGPSFVQEPGGGLAGVDWRFNGWGGANADFGKDAEIARGILSRLGFPVVTSVLGFEGGAFHVDGEGTVLTTESVVFHENRNPGLTRAQAEAEFARTLGARKTIWLPGDREEHGTNGHVDGIACFVRPGVVMVEQVAADDPWAETCAANRAALAGATDAAGRALEILELPAAPPMGREGAGEWGYCASYINFLVVNGGVVMPAYGIAADAPAREAVAAAFPDRDVVQVDISTLAEGGGGIHCITQQEPAI